jgi:hypothetical protein
VHWKNLFNRFQLHDHAVIEEEVDPVAVIYRQFLVAYRDRDLAAHAEPQFLKLIDEAEFIRAFKEAGT